jgi:hypothetical protein
VSPAAPRLALHNFRTELKGTLHSPTPLLWSVFCSGAMVLFGDAGQELPHALGTMFLLGLVGTPMAQIPAAVGRRQLRERLPWPALPMDLRLRALSAGLAYAAALATATLAMLGFTSALAAGLGTGWGWWPGAGRAGAWIAMFFVGQVAGMFRLSASAQVGRRYLLELLLAGAAAFALERALPGAPWAVAGLALAAVLAVGERRLPLGELSLLLPARSLRRAAAPPARRLLVDVLAWAGPTWLLGLAMAVFCVTVGVVTAGLIIEGEPFSEQGPGLALLRFAPYLILLQFFFSPLGIQRGGPGARERFAEAWAVLPISRLALLSGFALHAALAMAAAALTALLAPLGGAALGADARVLALMTAHLPALLVACAPAAAVILPAHTLLPGRLAAYSGAVFFIALLIADMSTILVNKEALDGAWRLAPLAAIYLAAAASAARLLRWARG